MPGHNNRNLLRPIRVALATQLADGRLGLEQILGGNSPHTENEFGIHQFDLARQPARAGGGFRGFWIAVRRRAAFKDIGDEDLRSAQSDSFQHRVEQLPCAPHEGLALPVFFLARRLTDDHPLGVAIADAGAVGRQGLAAALVFSLVASVSVIAPVIAALALGERSRGPLDSLKTWLLANNSTIMLVVLTVLSAVMVAAGLEMIG